MSDNREPTVGTLFFVVFVIVVVVAVIRILLGN